MPGRTGQVLVGVAVGALLAATPLLEPPLGRLGSAFAMLLVLPPLAVALDALGWSERAAALVARASSRARRAVFAYAAWLATSALLSLDVAAVVAASVALRVGARAEANGDDDDGERSVQLRAAILGPNVGSLLFPFSNLTNLVLLSATGLSFAAYVGAALVPQLVAAIVAGLFVVRPASHAAPTERPDAPAERLAARVSLSAPDHVERLGGLVAMAVGLAAVIVGFGGGDVVVPFACGSGVLSALALGVGRIEPAALARSLPLSGLAVVLAAILLAGLVGSLAQALPRVDAGPSGIVLAAVVGAALSAALNNLPAAAVGAFWLVGAGPHAVVAFLVGTNVAALATPHGSVATMLARSAAGRDGVPLSAARYLRSGWRFAVAPSIAALVAVLLVG